MSASSNSSGNASTTASSSRHNRDALHSDASHSRDIDTSEHDRDVDFDEDPMQELALLNENTSFKRKARPVQPSLASRFLSTAFGRTGHDRPASSTRNTDGRGSDLSPPATSSPPNASFSAQDIKDMENSDWHVEGPGRRVGYDNLTAIDWTYEYTKERTRLRHLTANAPGLIGQLKILADSSQVWWILVATGISMGAIAAGITVVSDWMGDMKQGICSNVRDGGAFYLNKSFCCWGIDSYAECSDWRPWSAVLGVRARGGSYLLEYLAFVIFSMLFASCASLLVTRFSPFAKQSGIPEIKTVLGGFVIRRFLGAWTLVVKSLGLCLAFASGLWLGKEGPLVHVACCCANLFMKLFDNINSNEARKRETFSAAAASGISVAFGSPIGGVMFSLEQLSYYFPDKTMWASFVCAMVAAVTLQAFDPFRTGKLVLFEVTYHSGWHAFELIPFAIIGLIGGLYGAMFIKVNMYIAAWRTSSRNPFLGRPVLEVAMVALVTAMISFPVTFLRAQSNELVEYLFAECRDITDDYLGLCKSGVANTGVIFILLFSAILGFFLATVTFGLQIPAGILLPSMAIGALYGRVIGLIVEVWQREHPNFFVFASCKPDVPCITPGTYAVIGAASALAGSTRMVVSIVVIMFELTGALTYVLPIMIAVMLSKWVADAFGRQGIYEAWIQYHGYPFLDNRDDTPVADIPVVQIMTRAEDLVCITATGNTIESLKELLHTHRFRGFPVVKDLQSNLLLGYVSRTELQFALDTALSSTRGFSPETECNFRHQPLADPTTTLDLRSWMDQTPITLSSRSSLQLTNDMFQKLGLRYILFTSRGALHGLLTKKDLWYVLNEDNASRSGRGRMPSSGAGNRYEVETALMYGHADVDDLDGTEARRSL